MSKNKYLDLLTLKPGDILFTSEWTIVSIFIQISQILIHPCKKGYPYSHASIFLSPQFIYESTRKKGVAITTINILDQAVVTNDQSDSKYIANPRILNGRMVLLWDVSCFRKIAIKRHANIDKLDDEDLYSFQDELLINGLKDHLRPYPKISYFLNLLPDVIKTRRFIQKRINPSLKNHDGKPAGKFCSELVARCYKRVSDSLFKENVDPATVSPKILAGNKELTEVKSAFSNDYGESLDATKSNLKSELGERMYSSIESTISGHFDHFGSLGLSQDFVETLQKMRTSLLDSNSQDARIQSQIAMMLQSSGQEQAKAIYNQIQKNVQTNKYTQEFKIKLHASEDIIAHVLNKRYNWWELQKINSCFDENCPLPQTNQGEGSELHCSISAMCTDQNVNNIPECVHPHKIRELVDKLKKELYTGYFQKRI